MHKLLRGAGALRTRTLHRSCIAFTGTRCQIPHLRNIVQRFPCLRKGRRTQRGTKVRNRRRWEKAKQGGAENGRLLYGRFIYHVLECWEHTTKPRSTVLYAAYHNLQAPLSIPVTYLYEFPSCPCRKWFGTWLNWGPPSLRSI